VENSVIVGLLIHIGAYLKEQYQQSALKAFLDRLLGRLEKGKQQSVLLDSLGAESRMGDYWKDSTFFGVILLLLEKLKKLLYACSKAMEEFVAGSVLLSATDRFLSNIFNYSIRSYGAFFLALFGTEGALWAAFQVNELKYVILRGGLLFLALVMLLLKASVAELFKGSVAYRFVENGFVDRFIKYDPAKAISPERLSLIMIMAAGVVAGILAYIFPAKLFLGGLAAAFLTVLILWRYEFGVFIGAGAAALLPTTALYFIIGLTILSFLCKWVLGKLPKYNATPIDALLVMFFLVLCYSTLTSYFAKNSFNVWIIYSLFLAFYFILTRTINSRYRLYLLIALLLISGALTSLYGIYQYWGGAATTSAWVDTTMFEDIGSRVGSTFNNPNILGEYLIMMIPLALGVLWYRKKLPYKVIYVGILGVMGICMLLTFSRGAWLGLIVALVGFFIVRDKRLFLLFLVALLIMPFALPDSVMHRFTSIGNLSDTSSSYRMSILIGSLRMAGDYWLSGIGLGAQSFEAIYPKYSLAAAYAHHSHNIYLQIILEMGAAGALVFMLIVLVFVRSTLAHQGKTKDRFLSSVMIASCTGVGGYLVQGLVENIWYNYRVLHIFWVVVAVGLCAIRLARDEVKTDA
jgi:putative inorganic carbon (HCO3(-)) transporter